jgi:hypothetical protein
MGSIYQNAHLTIAAVSSSNSSGGCFMKDRRLDVCLKISNNMDQIHILGARVLDKKGSAVSVNDINDHYPLLTRAWVLQEYFLSPRLLQCNYGEFTFECLESSRCECSSKLAPHQQVTREWLGSLSFTHRQRLSRTTAGFKRGAILAWKHDAMVCWKDIIRIYMQLELSYPSDVLRAISGCAQALALHLNLNYVAGIWQEMLPTDLLWYVNPPKKRVASKARPTDSWAPSWSWASVQMGQTIKHIDCHGVIPVCASKLTRNLLLRDAIKEVHCEPESASNSSGKPKDVYLRFNAVLYPWYLRWFCQTAQLHTHSMRKRHWAIDLHIKRLNPLDECINETQGLSVNAETYELRLDARLRREALEIEMFSHCIGDASHRCGLSQIYLLRALQIEGLPRTFDAFLLLERISPVNGKPNCYRRIGLMTLAEEGADRRTWDEIILGRIEPRQEEFWLF